MTAIPAKVEFPSASGQLLAGTLDAPTGKPLAYALWAHCFSCTKDNRAASRIAQGLTARGIAVLRFDFTGIGASAGDFGNTNFSSNVDDLIAAADYLRENYEAPQILIGHSWGGTAVLAGAFRVPEAKAVCTIAAPADPAHVAKLFAESLDDINEQGQATVVLAGRSFHIKKQFLDDIADQALLKKVAQLRRALLIFHSPTDLLVGIENASAIFEAAKHPKSFVSLDDADHLLSRPQDANFVATMIAAWAERYIVSRERLAEVVAPAGAVVVAETGEGKFTNAISVGGQYSMYADEPLEHGGNDSGPTPYDFLLAGLGACKAMTMRMYADRKGFPLDRVQVTLRHKKIHAEDCEECETRVGKIDRIDVVVKLSGKLDAESLSKIEKISEKCPVHRTLVSAVSIKSRYLRDHD